MAAPICLTFRHLPRTGALEQTARDIGNRLQRLDQRMTACHIVLEGVPSGSQPHGTYQVKIQVSVPGAQIHAESGAMRGDAGGSALHSAYENARRQLEKLKRLQTWG